MTAASSTISYELGDAPPSPPGDGYGPGAQIGDGVKRRFERMQGLAGRMPFRNVLISRIGFPAFLGLDRHGPEKKKVFQCWAEPTPIMKDASQVIQRKSSPL